MSDDAPLQLNRPLYERWRSTSRAAAVAAPNALVLAAYLDGRLSEAEAEGVEAALATDPQLLDAFLDLKRPIVPEIPSTALIREAQAAVPATAVIMPFKSPKVGGRTGNSRTNPWAAWGAVAASLVLVSLVGFDLGIQTERAISWPVGSEMSNDVFYQSATMDDGIG